MLLKVEYTNKKVQGQIVRKKIYLLFRTRLMNYRGLFPLSLLPRPFLRSTLDGGGGGL